MFLSEVNGHEVRCKVGLFVYFDLDAAQQGGFAAAPPPQNEFVLHRAALHPAPNIIHDEFVLRDADQKTAFDGFRAAVCVLVQGQAVNQPRRVVFVGKLAHAV